MIERTHAANVESMLSQIRKFQSQIGTQADTASAIASGPQARQVEKPGFGDAVKNAIAAVNETQANARAAAAAYERGEEIPLAEVVLGMQKASLAFEATLQVRNKVLKAYEDILNMPV
jgi:flagellar hook-basal body complex protein FliE